MASDRQIQANRENAKHSTGPRSETGKAISSRNNTRHALTAAGLIIIPGLEEAFANHQQDLRASVKPEGELQEVLYARILLSSWNLVRCRIAEKQLYDDTSFDNSDPLLDRANSDQYDRIQKYSRQNQSGFDKALKSLGELQTEAAYRARIAPPVIEDPPNPPVEVEQSPHALSEACSLSKVTATINREQTKSQRNSTNDPSPTRPTPKLASNWKNELPANLDSRRPMDNEAAGLMRPEQNADI